MTTPVFKTEHRGFYSYRYRSDDNGQTWLFQHSEHENQVARRESEQAEQARIQRELK